jgi:predicted nucleic acid-binding protein
MKQIYVDTSVFGGIFDDEFKIWSGLFFQKIITSQIKLIISDVVISELDTAPVHVRDFVNSIPRNLIMEVALTNQAVSLAEQYVLEKVVGETSLNDCLHIALATLNGADQLVSWNFKHIVNTVRIKGYNAVNLKNGYTKIEISNPREVFDYENDNR